MIPNEHRAKGAGPQLGVTADGQRGPFGIRGQDDGEDDVGEDQELPDLDPVGAVNNRVAQLVAQARARRERQRAQRQAQQEARAHGLAARHAAKLARDDGGQQSDAAGQEGAT